MKTTINLLFVVMAISFGFINKPAESPAVEKGMIKVSVFYPAGEGKTFDWNYYSEKHVPMVKNLLGDSVKVITIDKGISGRTPGSPVIYVAMFNMYFKTITAYQNSFGPNADKIVKDIPNYTNIQPLVQISEVQQ